MKAFVVLALCVSCVCDANILWHEPPKTNLDLVKDAFWDYVAKATLTAEESLEKIRRSELGQELNTRISQSADAVSHYMVVMRTHVGPLTQDFMAQFSQQAEQLKAVLDKDLTAVSSTLKPYVEKLVADLQTQVEDLTRDVTPLAQALDPETVKTMLLQKSQEMRGQLEKSMNELQAQMAPLTEEMKQKMEQSLEEFQSSMVPMAQNFQNQLTQKTQELQQSLVPFGEEVRTKLDTSAQDLQAQLTALWDSFTRKTQ